MQISIYANFGRVHGHTEDIKISLNVSLKGSPKEVFPIKKYLNQHFHFKICKKTLLVTQKLKIGILASKVMSGLPTVKTS